MIAQLSEETSMEMGIKVLEQSNHNDFLYNQELNEDKFIWTKMQVWYLGTKGSEGRIQHRSTYRNNGME